MKAQPKSVRTPATIGRPCHVCEKPAPGRDEMHLSCLLGLVRRVLESRDRAWPTTAELRLREVVR